MSIKEKLEYKLSVTIIYNDKKRIEHSIEGSNTLDMNKQIPDMLSILQKNNEHKSNEGFTAEIAMYDNETGKCIEFDEFDSPGIDPELYAMMTKKYV